MVLLTEYESIIPNKWINRIVAEEILIKTVQKSLKYNNNMDVDIHGINIIFQFKISIVKFLLEQLKPPINTENRIDLKILIFA